MADDARLGGLSAGEVADRVAAGRVNRAPPAPARTLRQVVRANVVTRFNAILGGLLVVVLVVGPPQDELFGLVLAANIAIGVAQELHARRTLGRLSLLSATRARVRREGRGVEVPVGDVVEGDVVLLAAGDQVVVDGTVLASDGLELDESLLTGEGEPVAAGVGAVVHSGSAVVAGAGAVRADGVGPAATAAVLAHEAARFSLVRSELQQGTNRILRLVTWVMVPTAAALLATQLVRVHQPAGAALRGSVAGVAAMVPEGLVLLTSLAFAAGAVRLARRRVLVQELAAVEGLARVDVVCLDKTGTLTAPGMRLAEVAPLDGTPQGELRAVLHAMAASDPAPNASARALLDPAGDRTGWTARARVPFRSARRWSAVTFEGRGTWVLGAPELFGRYREGGGPGRAVGPGRVLVLGEASEEATPSLRLDRVRPRAVVRLAEELRPDAAATVGFLLAQGVAVKVLSGDAPATVAEVAWRVGLAKARAVDASALADDEALAAALRTSDVLGRILPHQKRSVVEALQRDGHVVAMIGDGVNDVPALKAADLGIAMGSGSAAARAVARVVLLDSAFASVPAIVAEGRRVVANIERVARLFVAKTVYAALLAVTVAIAAVPFPFFPRHLTVVSTFTIGLPGLALAFGSAAPKARPGFVRRVLAFAAPVGGAAAVAAFVAYQLARSVAGVSLGAARSTATVALAAVGLWAVAVVAGPLDARRAALVAAMAGATAATFLVAPARRLLGVEAPPDPALAGAAAGLVLAVVVFAGWRRRRSRVVPLTPPGRR
ncbi:MAG: HAD-IC family P-type ATPase [Actinomycetota bacterium]|nr:HAD-IC family P-type ATPase [Actinomycetota bacterium]